MQSYTAADAPAQAGDSDGDADEDEGNMMAAALAAKASIKEVNPPFMLWCFVHLKQSPVAPFKKVNRLKLLP